MAWNRSVPSGAVTGTGAVDPSNPPTWKGRSWDEGECPYPLVLPLFSAGPLKRAILKRLGISKRAMAT